MKARGEVRIIGGAWRGRRVRFREGGVRPTPDRVRETLFNWLAGVLPGARCLDLCAGSGVLGFESLSRGAATAVLVDASATVVGQLAAEAARLGARGVRVQRADALTYLRALRGMPPQFEVVFLDPPYGAGLMPRLLAELADASWLGEGGRVYVELPVAAELIPPPGYTPQRSGRAGQVGYHLLARGAA